MNKLIKVFLFGGIWLACFLIILLIILPDHGHLLCWYTDNNAQHHWGDHRNCTKEDYAKYKMPVPKDIK